MEQTAKKIYNIIREKPYKDGEQMIINHVRQQCKKQREICWENILIDVKYKELVEDAFKDSVLNAPEPEFE